MLDFRLAETRTFLNGFHVGTRPALRWRAMAQRKLGDLDELTTRISQMRSILNASFHCECHLLEDCEQLIAAKARCGSESGSRKSKYGEGLADSVAQEAIGIRLILTIQWDSFGAPGGRSPKIVSAQC
jgi:hypothetical protein